MATSDRQTRGSYRKRRLQETVDRLGAREDRLEQSVKDPLEEFKNKNILIVGRVGSGKTVTAEFIKKTLSETVIFHEIEQQLQVNSFTREALDLLDRLVRDRNKDPYTLICCALSSRSFPPNFYRHFDLVIYTNQHILLENGYRQYAVYDTHEETHDLFDVKL